MRLTQSQNLILLALFSLRHKSSSTTGDAAEMGIWHLVGGGSDGNAGLLNWNAACAGLQSLM